MKKLWKVSMYFSALAVAVLFAASLLPVMGGGEVAWAACDLSNPSITDGAECARGNEQPADLFGDGGIFQRITNILLFLVGAIAVIMLIIGGIRYVISGGDQGQVTAAKNTILYAIIGIVVAFLAYAAINFVIGQLVEETGAVVPETSLHA